jgi:hypothetical protein
MTDNGRVTAKSPKEAALLALRRAKQEPEPMVVQALISIAIDQIGLIQELARPRREKKAKESA